VRPARPTSIRATVKPLRAGSGDPTMRVHADRFVRAWHTPAGPSAMRVRQVDQVVEAEAWGAGADWALDVLPRLLGADDDDQGFEPRHPAVERAHRRHPGLRMGATGQVADVIVSTIIGQKVTGKDATTSWRRLVYRYGEPAPGIEDLWLPPVTGDLAGLSWDDFHPLGLERTRATTIIEVARRLARLEEAATMPAAEADARLRAIRGVGPWTAGVVRRLAFGDPDAVEVGDFHLKNHVAWNLAGEPRGTDERMLELLEPWRGQRGRVVRLLKADGERAPTWGPRMPSNDVARL
jgi:3-methyladenine DNA glycosylase/8-oxoguanine DNA glycosylase